MSLTFIIYYQSLVGGGQPLKFIAPAHAKMHQFGAIFHRKLIENE